MMSWGKTLLLMLVLVALSLYFYIYEIKGAAEKKLAEERRKEEEWKRSQIFPYHSQELCTIRLVKNTRTILYQKEENGWWMKQPMIIKGDKNTADDIIQSIISVVETDPVTDSPVDLAQFGLDQPAMEISVQREGEEQVKTLLLGTDNPTSTTIYAKIKDSPRIFLVGSLIRWEVDKEFYHLDHQTGPFFTGKEGT